MTVGHAATSLGSRHEDGIDTPRGGSGTCSVKLGSSELQPNVSSDVEGIATLSPAGFLASISIRQVAAAQDALYSSEARWRPSTCGSP